MTAPVSRETRVPEPPLAARGLFGEALPRAIAFAELLCGPAVERGLLGPREAPRIWSRHLLNCGVVAGLPPAGATVADVGSGAGLPGILWAVQRPDLQLTLLEPSLRRSNFLREAVQALALGNVDVLRTRAEQLPSSCTYRVVAARAVAPLERLAQWCLPLLQPGGELIALKGATAASELRAARPALNRLGATSGSVSTYGEGIVSPPTTVVRVRVVAPGERRRSR